MKTRFVFLTSLAAISALSTASAGIDVASVAAAQRTERNNVLYVQPKAETRLITGSNIPQTVSNNGIENVSSSPVRIIGNDGVNRYGSGNVSDILRRYPEFSFRRR